MNNLIISLLVILFFYILFIVVPFFIAEWLFEKQEEKYKVLELLELEIQNDIEELRNQNSELRDKLDEKAKIIELMAEDRSEISEPKVSKEAIIDFYYKKVKEENE